MAGCEGDCGATTAVEVDEYPVPAGVTGNLVTPNLTNPEIIEYEVHPQVYSAAFPPGSFVPSTGAAVWVQTNTSPGEVFMWAYVGGTWKKIWDCTMLGNCDIGALGNVASTAPTSGQVLQWNGTAWVPASLPTVTSWTVEQLEDVVGGMVGAGTGLTYNDAAGTIVRACDGIAATVDSSSIGAVPALGTTSTIISTSPLQAITAPATRVCPMRVLVRFATAIDLPHVQNTRFFFTLQLSLNGGAFTTYSGVASTLWSDAGTRNDVLTLDSTAIAISVAPGASYSIQARLLGVRTLGGVANSPGTFALSGTLVAVS